MNIFKNILKIDLTFILLATSILRATKIRNSMVIANDPSYKIPLKEYSRIVVLDSATVENIYLLGALDKIIATVEIKQIDKIMETYPHLALTRTIKNNNIIAISPMRVRMGSLNIFDTIEKLHNDLKKIKLSR